MAAKLEEDASDEEYADGGGDSEEGGEEAIVGTEGGLRGTSAFDMIKSREVWERIVMFV